MSLPPRGRADLRLRRLHGYEAFFNGSTEQAEAYYARIGTPCALGVQLTLSERISIYNAFIDYTKLKGETHQDSVDIAIGAAGYFRNEIEIAEVTTGTWA